MALSTFATLTLVPAASHSFTGSGSDSGSEIVVRRTADGILTLTGGGGGAKKQRGTGGVTRRREPPRELSALISREAQRNGLDRRLVEAITQIESAFDQTALSSKGAIGLMQLMPETARDLGVADPWDAEQNVAGGSRYLRQMLDRFGGKLEHALAAYNAGPGAVERYGGIPPYRETIEYVKKVLGVYRGEVPRIVAASGSSTRPRTVPIRVQRDANGHLVMTTP